MRLTLLTVHILAGATGLMTGFVALFATKGALLHRRLGLAFVCAMTTMAIVGSTIAIAWNRAPGANAPVGLLTAYLVITGLTTVRPPRVDARRLEIGLLVLVCTTVVVLTTFALKAAAAPTGTLYGMPPYPFLIFAVIGAMAIRGDVRLIRAGGGATIRGARRLTRHLWRMCTALLIAAFSFFLGQAKVIPKPIRIVPLLLIPPLVVLAALLYWLWRVRFRQSLRGLVVTSPTAGLESSHAPALLARDVAAASDIRPSVTG